MAKFTFDEYIVADPNICHGKPTFKGTRIMVWQILELMEAAITPAEIISPDYFPQLTLKHIEAALGYAGELVKTREYAA